MTEATETREPTPGSPQHKSAARRGELALGITLALVALGDWLLFWQAGGLSIFLFILAVAAGIVIVHVKAPEQRKTGFTLAAAVGLALPLLEAPSVPGLLLALLGLAALGLAAAGLLAEEWVGLPKLLARFTALAPVRFFVDVVGVLGNANVSGLRRAVVVWILPIAFVAIFTGLFWSANAVIADVLGHLEGSLLSFRIDFWRVAGWVVLAAGCWPLLRPRLMRLRVKAPAEARAAMPAASLLFGPAAILRALLLFNAIFAVETLLDLTYLWGGAALPDGMTYADYAHRGAYPLVLTALLAAAFVLAAMRPGGAAQQSPLIRGLVYAWIAQNILLCISSIRRLELYVETYSLTEMRVASAIWMLLVAAGLVLILLRIRLRRSNEWLVAMNLATLALTLYICSFIDGSAFIAGFNVDHSRRLGGPQPLDIAYFRELGPTTIPALDRYIAALPQQDSDDDAAREMREALANCFTSRDVDWRSWSYRDWRLGQYLAAQPTAPLPSER